MLGVALFLNNDISAIPFPKEPYVGNFDFININVLAYYFHIHDRQVHFNLIKTIVFTLTN